MDYKPTEEELREYREANDLTVEGCERRMKEFWVELGPRRDLIGQLRISPNFPYRPFTR
jgi:hypothetical protein